MADMGNQELQPGISRRGFLKAGAAVTASAFLAACGATEASSPAPSRRTNSPKEVLTPEAKQALEVFPSINPLTEEFLVQGVAGTGGPEILPTPNTGQLKEAPQMTMFEYSRRAWGKELDLTDGLDVLRYLVASGNLAKITDTTYDLSRVYPKLKTPDGNPLRFLPLKLNTLPQNLGEIIIDSGPSKGISIKSGTTMTILSNFESPDFKQWAGVTLTDPTQVDEKGVEKHQFAVIPTTLLVKLVKHKGWEAEGTASNIRISGFGQEDGEARAWETNVFESTLARKFEQAATNVEGLAQQYRQTKDGRYEYVTEKGEVLSIPNVPGLTTELIETQDGKKKVAYFTESGEYAGEFVPGVVMETRQTGGVVLTPSIAEGLINSAVAAITNQQDKWVVIPPVDPRGGSPEDVILITHERGRATGVRMLKLLFPNPLPMTNIIPNNSQLQVESSHFYEIGYTDPITLTASTWNNIVPGREFSYLTTAGTLNVDNKPVNIRIQSYFGARLGTVGSPVVVVMGAAQETRDITPDKILQVEGKPVFLASNSQ